jgi:hypothetical protein
MSKSSAQRTGCVIVLTLAACSGQVGDVAGGDPASSRPDQAPGTQGTSSAPGATPVGPGGAAPGTSVPESAGAMPLRRLSRIEYDNTIRDLLGNTAKPGSLLPDDGIGPSGYADPGKVSAVEARGFGDAADQVAAAAVKDLPKLMGCDPTTAEATCVPAFVGRFGKRVYRRPIATTEVTDLQALYKDFRTRHDVPESMALLVAAMLQSPFFLYHWELGDAPATREGALVRLGPYELASRISYLLWRSMPDDALFAAADGGRLRSADDVTREARRMLADDRARDAVSDFHLQWARVDFTNVDKDRKTYPLWSSQLQAAMVAETRAFVEDLFLKGDARLATLLTSSSSFANPTLAKLYGVGAPSGSDLAPVTLDATQRAGIFTLAGFLAAQGAETGSHPVRRGKVIFERVACGEIPPPPANVPPPRPSSPNLSTRERFAEHAQNPCAAACHGLIDPPGFAFENYDGIGAWRTTDGGKPVDATGTLNLPIAGPQRFASAVDMMKLLGASEDARRCLVTQWGRYGLGRHESQEDAGSLGRASDVFRARGGDMRELLVALVSSKTFLYRQAAAGEVF